MGKQVYPEPTVGALIVNREGKIFLMRSHKWRGQYCIPGGHIEVGETIEQAVVREVKEETGLDVYDLEFVCFQEFIGDASFWKKRHFIFFDYACRTNSTEVTLNDEAQSYVWASLWEARSLPIEQYTVKVIDTYLAEKDQGE
jgi:nucleoside triphosphatase